MAELNEESVRQVADLILADYKDTSKYINKIDLNNQPDKQVIIDILHKLLKILYPGYNIDQAYKLYSIENTMASTIEDVIFHLNQQLKIVFRYFHTTEEMSDAEVDEKASDVVLHFMSKIPEIRDYLETDIEAAFEGDPAAGSRDEIIMCYPGFYATTVYRLAHELTVLGVPMIPRIMTEHAHARTGIDIHPGATIGKYFFMDHGTGIVIGETTTIGEHVKVYQGVTLGALSTRGGQKLKSVKRHPTIGDNVTIYSGCTILGGETVIEENVTVGGNSFITESISKGSRVSIKTPELNIR